MYILATYRTQEVAPTWLLSIDATTGAVDRPLHVMDTKPAEMVTSHLPAEGDALFRSDKDLLQRLDPPTGAPMWTVASAIGSPQAFHEGLFYSGSIGALVRAIDPRSGAVVWTYGIGSPSHPHPEYPSVSWVPDPPRPGHQLLAGGTADGVTSFDRDVVARPQRRVTIHGNVVDGVRLEKIRVGDQLVPLSSETSEAQLFSAAVVGRGVFVVDADSAELNVAVDLEDGQSRYQVEIRGQIDSK